jgi:hypothetical protein
MSSSCAEEVLVEEVTQEIHEQQIFIKLDYLKGQDGP